MLELVFPHAVNQDEGSLVDHQWFSIVSHVEGLGFGHDNNLTKLKSK